MIIDIQIIKKAVLPLVCLVFLAGCASGTRATVRGEGKPADMWQVRHEKYDGPKARLAVVRFIDKTKKGSGNLGTGMSDMLITALFNSSRFILLDRTDLDDVINEQDFTQSGQVSDETIIKIDEIEGAELLVFGAVTSFEPEHIGIGGAIIGLLSFGTSVAISNNNKDDTPLGVVTYKESSITIDLKIVDSLTGRVVYAGSVTGKYENWGGGIIGGVGGGWSRTPVALGGFSGTGEEQAIRRCIEAAVTDIVQNTPDEFYRVDDKFDTTTIGALLPVSPLKLHVTPSPEEIPGPSARVIPNQEEFAKLLEELDVPLAGAESYDWENGTRLVAIFAGRTEKPFGHIGVKKAVDRVEYIEVQISEVVEGAPPPVRKDKEGNVKEPSESAYWPYEIARIETSGKPVKLLWLESAKESESRPPDTQLPPEL